MDSREDLRAELGEYSGTPLRKVERVAPGELAEVIFLFQPATGVGNN